jgi:proteasome assembly chaperone (PAC2) family protein
MFFREDDDGQALVGGCWLLVGFVAVAAVIGARLIGDWRRRCPPPVSLCRL